jgi:nanoRNase/pAp phosphatase (c-di-AMP/oligoRNAs hydrolase)
MSDQKFRLITRSDFDGLVCAVLLKELDLIDEILFVHPKDMQDGRITVTSRDISTNLPYVEGIHLAFDHHLSETLRTGTHENHIISATAPSAARVVWDYYGGSAAFPRVTDEMMAAVDKADSAAFTPEEILDPGGWVLLSYLMDARTGLGRFREFRVSNYQLMIDLIDYCRTHGIDDILGLPDVRERVDLYFEHDPQAKQQIRRCTKIQGRVAVLDLRNETTIYATNRFMIYALFPKIAVSVHVLWGRERQNTVLAVGKSIIDRSSKANIGAICLEYGGGGHEAAGTCQIANDRAEQVLTALVGKLDAAG